MPRRAKDQPSPRRSNGIDSGSMLRGATTQRAIAVAVFVVGLAAILTWTVSNEGRPDVAVAGPASTMPPTVSTGATVTPGASPPPATVASTTASSAPTTVPPTTTAPVRPTGAPITIAFAGDINGEGLPDADMADAMAARLAAMAPTLSGADLTIANLETAITNRGAGAAKAFTFRAPPSILDGLRSAGIDIASMANNHGMDYGLDGLSDSLAARASSPIPVIGVGANDAEAFAPAKVTVKGQRVSVLAATQVLDRTLADLWTATPVQPGLASAKRVDRLVAEVRKARTDSDVVIVFLHWGVEKSTCPSQSQQDLARTLADAGADVIIGGHAHRVQGGGFLGTAFVDYGLGNFAFRALGPEAQRTGVLTVTVQGRAVQAYRWVPGIIQDSSPLPLSGADALRAVDTWNALRTCTGLSPAPS